MKKSLILIGSMLVLMLAYFSCGKKNETKVPLITVVLSPTSSEISSQTGSSATIEVISSASLSADATAVIEVVAGSAPETEYTTSPALASGKITISLPKGSTRASFTVTATKNDAETDRNVTFRLTSVNGANLGANTQHTVKIKGKTKDPVSDFLTIEQIQALPRGPLTAYNGKKLAGVVVLAKDNITNRNLVLQNGNFGVVVRFEANNTFDIGDSIQITFAAGDSIGFFNQVRQVFAKLTNTARISSGIVSTPKTITIAQLNSRLFEGTLVRINSVTFRPGQGTLRGEKTFLSGSDSSFLFTQSASASTNSTFSGEPVPNGTGSLIGVAGSFNGKPQLYLRKKEDLVGFVASGSLTASVGSLDNFGEVKKGEKSASKSYTFTGTGLTANVTVSAPSNFEISKDNTNFSSSLSFTMEEVTGKNVTVYARFAPNSGTNGAKSGAINHSSTGVNAATVTVNGSETGNESTSSLLVNENFDYGTSNATHLPSVASSWLKHSGADDMLYLGGTNLSYSGYPGNSGGAVELKIRSRSGDCNRALSAAVNSGTFYAALLVRVDAYSSSLSDSSTYFFHTIDASGTSVTTNFKARLYVKRGSAAGKAVLGITKGSVLSDAAFMSSDLDMGTTYLVVVKYQFNTGSTTDDVVSMHVVSGTIPTNEPSTPTVTAPDNSSNDYSSTGILSVALRQGQPSGSGGTGSVVVDGIRVGTSWADVVK